MSTITSKPGYGEAVGVTDDDRPIYFGEMVHQFLDETVLAAAASDAVNQAAGALSDASVTAVAVSTADVSAPGATYAQAWAQEVEALANDNKATINSLVADVAALKDAINALLAVYR